MLATSLVATAACKRNASRSAEDSTAYDPSWTERMRDAVQSRAPWPVDLVLGFRGQHAIEGADHASERELLRIEGHWNPGAFHELSFQFTFCELPHDAAPLADDQKQFAGLAMVEDGKPFAWPQFVLADAAGRPYAVAPRLAVGGGAVWAKAVAELQDVRIERDARFAHAAQLGGVARARELAAALDLLGEDITAWAYAAEVRAIVAADADGRAGLRDRFALQLQWAAGRDAILALVAESGELLRDRLMHPVRDADGKLQLTSMDFTPLRALAAKAVAAHADNELVRQIAQLVEICGGLGRRPVDTLQQELAAARARIGHDRVRGFAKTLEKLLEELAAHARR